MICLQNKINQDKHQVNITCWMNNSKNDCEGFSFFRISYELGEHFITPSGVSWTPLGAFYELFTFHLAFYIIWWTSGGAFGYFVADHQTNFWRCNLWSFQKMANVYQQVLTLIRVNLMIYQASLPLYKFHNSWTIILIIVGNCC